MKLLENKTFSFLLKMFILILVTADLIINVIILKQNKDIKNDLYYMDMDINSVDSNVDDIKDSISDINKNIDIIERNVSDIEYYLR